MEFPKGFLLKYATRLGNARPVPEAVFMGTKGTFDTESWTARGEGGGKDKLTEPVTVPKPEGARTFAAGTSSPEAPALSVDPTPGMLDQRVSGDGHVKNWLECVRSRKTPNADIKAAYNHSVALCMTIAALQTGKRVTFDDVKQSVVVG